jgi:hypothetical protein
MQVPEECASRMVYLMSGGAEDEDAGLSEPAFVELLHFPCKYGALVAFECSHEYAGEHRSCPCCDSCEQPLQTTP